MGAFETVIVNQEKLSIVIVNWNVADLLRNCLLSILNNRTSHSFRIIVIDNASTDESVEILNREFPTVELIQNITNLGYAKATNNILRKVRSEYTLLLNPDTVLEDRTTLDRWINLMDRHERCGVSGCRLIFPDGSHQMGDAGFLPSFQSIVYYTFFLARIAPTLFKGLFIKGDKLKKEMEVGWISLCAFLIRNSILDSVGILDERWFLFAEDVEWCSRFKSKEYKVFYLPQLKVVHFGGSSVKKQLDQKAFSTLWMENLRILYKMLNKRQPIVVFDLFMSAAYLLRFTLYLLCYLLTGKEKCEIFFRKMFATFWYIVRKIGKPVRVQ